MPDLGSFARVITSGTPLDRREFLRAGGLTATVLLSSTVACGGSDSPTESGDSDDGGDSILDARITSGDTSGVLFDAEGGYSSTYDGSESLGAETFQWTLSKAEDSSGSIPPTLTGDEPTQEVTFEDTGHYTVTLTVADAQGREDSEERAVTIRPFGISVREIQGPREIRLEAGGTATGAFRAELSGVDRGMVNPDQAEWYRPDGGGEVPLGDGSAVEVTFDSEGSSAIGVKVVGNYHKPEVDLPQEASSERDVTILPPYGGPTYQNPIGLISYTPDVVPRLVFMDPDTLALEVVLTVDDLRAEFGSAATFNAQGLAFDPLGSFVVISVNRGGANHDLVKYNLGGGSFEPLLDDGQRIVQHPCMNPMLPYVVAISDRRWDGSADELVVSRTDSGPAEFRYLSEEPEQVTRGFYPAWSGDGQKIAAGNAVYELNGNQIRRIAIFENPFGDLRSRRRLTSESQLQDLLGGDYRPGLSEGINGLAWSPDGEEIAFHLILGSRQMVATIRSDGTGPITLITDDGTFPNYSPDGEVIRFTRFIGGGFHIIEVPRGGGAERDLSAESPDPTPDHIKPTHFG